MTFSFQLNAAANMLHINKDDHKSLQCLYCSVSSFFSTFIKQYFQKDIEVWYDLTYSSANSSFLH